MTSSDGDRAGSPSRLQSLQALRFIAVLGVMIHHALNASQPLSPVHVGAAGVDVFFVISGIVIGYMDHDDGPRVFALKRLIRVVPLYWLATAFYFVVRTYVLQDAAPPSAEYVARSLFFAPDAVGWLPLYYPGWSLGYELVFYALFGALLLVVGNRAVIVCAVLAIFLAGARIPAPFGPDTYFDTSFFLLFGVGLLLAEGVRNGITLPEKFGWLAIALAIAGFAMWPFPFPVRLLSWGIPAILLVAGVLALERLPALRSKTLMLGGDASYALYLFHLPIMEMIVRFAPLWGLDLDSRIRFIVLRVILLVGVSLAVCIPLHIWIEKPLLRTFRRIIRRPPPVTSQI